MPTLFGTVPHILTEIAVVATGVVASVVLIFKVKGHEDQHESLVQTNQYLKRKLVSLEKQLETTQNELKECIQTKDEYTSILSHELKTPLTSLSLQLQMLNRSMDGMDLSPEKFKSTLHICERQSRRLGNMLDHLHELTSIQIGKLSLNKEPVELSTLVQEVVESYHLENGTRSAITVRSSIPIIGNWDRTRMEQVVNNLISNAVKYGDGNPINISIDCDTLHHTVILTIQDHGMGIPSHCIDKIFDRYHRAVPESKGIAGLGLGLYIVRQVIEAHGGTIQVKSVLNEGTTFTLNIPLFLAADQNANRRPTAPPV